MINLKENGQRLAFAAGLFGEIGVDSVKDARFISGPQTSSLNHICIVELCSCIFLLTIPCVAMAATMK